MAKKITNEATQIIKATKNKGTSANTSSVVTGKDLRAK